MCDETNSKSKRVSKLNTGQFVRKDSSAVFIASQFPYMVLCPNLMTVYRKGSSQLLKELEQSKHLSRKSYCRSHHKIQEGGIKYCNQ